MKHGRTDAKKLTKRNPVNIMDSVDAMDLMARAVRALRECGASPELVAAIREQKLRHHRALRRLIGDESLEDK